MSEEAPSRRTLSEILGIRDGHVVEYKHLRTENGQNQDFLQSITNVLAAPL